MRNKIALSLLLLVFFGGLSYAESCQYLAPDSDPSLGYCPAHFVCTHYQDSPLTFGNRCVRFECDPESQLGPWTDSAYCEKEQRVQTSVWQNYNPFPDCSGYQETRTRYVDEPSCIDCNNASIKVTNRSFMECHGGTATIREQVKACTITNGQKVWIDAERITTENQALCLLPVAGQLILNPLTALLLIITIIIILATFIVIKKK